MMGTQVEPAQLFYEFRLDDHVPADHLLQHIDRCNERPLSQCFDFILFFAW